MATKTTTTSTSTTFTSKVSLHPTISSDPVTQLLTSLTQFQTSPSDILTTSERLIPTAATTLRSESRQTTATVTMKAENSQTST